MNHDEMIETPAYEQPEVASYSEEELLATVEAYGASGIGGGPP
jgi:hypothetical protein